MNDKRIVFKKMRLDDYLVVKKLVKSRHQAADLIRRQQVQLNQKIIDKPSFRVNLQISKPQVQLLDQIYASRGGYKLASVVSKLPISFANQIILDVGAHQGGFTDYCLKAQAKIIIAIDVGSQLLAENLLKSKRIRAFPKQDIRSFNWPEDLDLPDIILVDVSFISIKKIWLSLLSFCKSETQLLILIKPQFEASKTYLNKGIVKNDTYRRQIFQDLERWLKNQNCHIESKIDSEVLGLKGNRERFYLLKPILKD